MLIGGARANVWLDHVVDAPAYRTTLLYDHGATKRKILAGEGLRHRSRKPGSRRLRMPGLKLGHLTSTQALVAAYPSVTLDADNAGRFLSGLRRRGEPGEWGIDAPLVQVYGTEPRAFLGSAHVTADELIPQRLLSPIEIQDILQAAQSSASQAAFQH